MIYTSRCFHIFMRRTTISNFSFLISHSVKVFNRNQGAPHPWTLHLLFHQLLQHRTELIDFILFAFPNIFGNAAADVSRQKELIETVQRI